MTNLNPVADHGPWSLGTLIAFPIGVLLILLGLAFAVYGLRYLRSPGRGARSSSEEGHILLWGGVLVAVIASALTAFGMFPYDSEYHQWRPVNGTVERIDKRLVKDGDSMSERFVVTIADQPFGVDDSRAATLEIGDEVALACKREWQYAAESGWACRWAEASR